MVRKSWVAALLGLLVLGASRPALADLKLLEPYGGIYSGRTFLGSLQDKRPKDAQQNQASTIDAARQRFLISPLFAHSDETGTKLSSFGGTIAYASSTNPRQPWQIQGSGLNNHVDVRGAGHTDIRQIDVTGKFVVFQPTRDDLPVVSVVGRYVDYDGIGHRWDALIAADQKVCRQVFATANLGWSRFKCDCNDTDAVVAGFGLTYVLSPKLSISADYTLSNASDGTDLWTVAASYALDRNSLVRIGGGKNSTLGVVNRNLIFADYVFKFDLK